MPAVTNPHAQVDRKIWLDGALVPWERATVHVLSHSLQRGSLIFDYMSVHETPRGPAIFRLAEHVRRLFRSADLVGLELPRGPEQLEAAAVETVRANPGAKAVKISAYLPSIEIDVVPVDDAVSIAIAAYDPIADIAKRKATQTRPPAQLRIWIEKDVRNRRDDIVPPQAKVAANYVSPMRAKWLARRAGYDEILLVDEAGYVAEGPTTNVFWVDGDGALRTPPSDKVLLGVTRSSVLDIAKEEGIPVTEDRVQPEALMAAREVFLTGTTAGIWPVASIDGQPVTDGEPGPVSLHLRERFGRIVAGGDPAFDHWLTYVEA